MRKVPIYRRGRMYYYTDDAGRRISLRTDDRSKALAAYNGRRTTGKASAEVTGESSPRRDLHSPPPPMPPSPPASDEGQSSAAGASPASSGGAPAAPLPDPLQQVGATAGAPPPVTPDAIAPPPATEADVRSYAEMISGFTQLLTAALVHSDGINPGVVSEATQNQQILRAMPLARRLAEMPAVRTWWVEAIAFGIVSAVAMQEQRDGGTPLDPRAQST